MALQMIPLGESLCTPILRTRDSISRFHELENLARTKKETNQQRSEAKNHSLRKKCGLGFVIISQVWFTVITDQKYITSSHRYISIRLAKIKAFSLTYLSDFLLPVDVIVWNGSN
jgi:hypothetical protein